MNASRSNGDPIGASAPANKPEGSVGTRIVVIFALLAFGVIGHGAVTFHYFAETESYGPLLDLAGRQRYHAQRLAYLLERASNSEEAYVLEEVSETMLRVDEALALIERGGSLGDRFYPAANERLRPALTKHRENWSRLRPSLERLLQGRDVRPGESEVDALTASAFALVDDVEAWRADLRRNVRFALAGTTALALGALIIAFRLAWRKIVTPVRELRDEALRASAMPRVSGGDDEIGTVRRVVTEMSESVGRLRVERRRFERRLRQVEADYQSVFDNAVAGIFQFTDDGELTLANPALARILGYDSAQELVLATRNVHRDLFADPEHERRIASEVAERGVAELQTQMIRRDGTRVWVLESASVSRDNGAGFSGEAVVVDITQMVRAQERLRELSGLLLTSQDRERRRIARELHDSTGQTLAALEMNLDQLRGLLQSANESLSLTGELAAQCSREIRSTSYLLHPPLLDELGLPFALRDYAKGFQKRSGIEVELDVPKDMPRLSQDAEAALFRVVQEALTNVQRHSGSSVARIRLAVEDDHVVVEVEDEGKGIPKELLEPGSSDLSRLGVGVRGMAERLNQLGGRMELASRPGRTTVRGEVSRAEAEVSRPAAEAG